METPNESPAERRMAPRDTELRFMRLKEVLALCGTSKTTLYKAMKNGKFPQAIKLSERSSAWVKSEVEAWMQQCIRNNRQR